MDDHFTDAQEHALAGLLRLAQGTCERRERIPVPGGSSLVAYCSRSGAVGQFTIEPDGTVSGMWQSAAGSRASDVS